MQARRRADAIQPVMCISPGSDLAPASAPAQPNDRLGGARFGRIEATPEIYKNLERVTALLYFFERIQGWLRESLLFPSSSVEHGLAARLL